MSHDKLLYPKRQKENLVNDLRSELLDAQSEGETYFSAFREVALRWLGYGKTGSPTIIDASNDRGFDAYHFSGAELDIFQFKAQDFNKKQNICVAADADLLADVRRILSFLQSGDFKSEAKNRKLKRFIFQLQTALQSEGSEEGVFVIHVYLVALYDQMTQAAKNEFELIKAQNSVIAVFGRDVLIDFEYVDIDFLLARRWRETNSQWVDATGQSSEWVTLNYATSGATGFIHDRSSLVLYVRARDLIDTYRRFGYQIFESNVRCEIVKSQVNDAIKSQIMTRKGIDEFRILNNGITIVCTNKEQPSNGKVRILRPQVVNGLQTITSLFDAYEDSLGPELQEYLDNNCYVLARIYDRQSVSDIPKLVKATNNQNKMEPRNLRSNDQDQISFEQSFARLKWFYERKDFAWTAFDRSENQWTTLRGFKSRDFKVLGKQGRPTIRKVDNQEVGQIWLAFLGYVDDAAQRRRLIFDDERYYTRIFQSRMTKHAFDYNFDFSSPKIEEEIILSSPSAESLLLSYLTYRLAKENVTTSAKVRDEIIKKRGYDHLTEEEADRKLTKDAEYICGLALSAGPFLFSEMCGLLLLRSFGADYYTPKARILLERTDMQDVFSSADFTSIQSKIETKKYGEKDIFTSLWLLFKHVVLTELAESDQWCNAFFTESSKPRIMYRESTRRRILERVLDLDVRAAGRSLNYDFSEFFDKVGIINHIRRVCK